MTHHQVQPFDENAALAELERLRQAIMAARRLRQQKSDEFEAFVQGFRRPVPTPPPPAMSHPERPAAPARVETAEPTAVSLPVTPQPLTEPSPVPLAATPSPAVEEPAGPAPSSPPTRARLDKRWAFAIGGGVAAIALGVLATRPGRPAPPSTPVDAVASEPSSAVPAERPAAAAAEPPAPAPAPQDAHAVVVDLKTLHPVWMRVVVDGEKRSEGMVQGGESLHFGGDDSIVVRVGNGGAVVVKNGDREDAFGAADQPLTRRFSKR